MAISGSHVVHGRSMLPPFPPGSAQVLFGMGCFWGAERKFWSLPGVHSTAVGYGGGFTPNPSYREVCSGLTGHTELVQVVFDPQVIALAELLKVFFENHDPTQGMRQGNDVGTQYRSAIYVQSAADEATAIAIRARFQSVLSQAALGHISSEIRRDVVFYYAEEEHQQYLAKNPGGYCGLGGTGLSCSIDSNSNSKSFG
jgi:peptide-methionine (S)-S-oxide reductase